MSYDDANKARATNPYAPAAAKYITVGDNRYVSEDPLAMSSAADLARAQRQGNTQAGIVAGIGAVGRVAQLGLAALPTAEDRENKKRLAELSKHKGLNQGELSELNHSLMDPVRALSTENRSRAEAVAAGSGQNDVSTLTRIQRNNEANTNAAALNAGIEVSRQNREQINADKREEQERIAYKGQRASERIAMISQTLGGLANTLGPVIAAGAVKTEPTDAELLRYQGLKTDAGAPVYPGLQGMNAQQLRQGFKNEMNR